MEYELRKGKFQISQFINGKNSDWRDLPSNRSINAQHAFAVLQSEGVSEVVIHTTAGTYDSYRIHLDQDEYDEYQRLKRLYEEGELENETP